MEETTQVINNGTRELIIDPDLKDLLPPVTGEQEQGLRADIKALGCLDPIRVWQGTLIDGHVRYRICRDEGLPYQMVELDFENKTQAAEWIIEHHQNRRQMDNDFMRIRSVLKFEEMLKKDAEANCIEGGRKGGVTTADPDKASHDIAKPLEPVHVDSKLAKLAGSNRNYVNLTRRIMSDPVKNAKVIGELERGEKKLHNVKKDFSAKEERLLRFLQTTPPNYPNPDGVKDTILCMDSREGVKKLPDKKIASIVTSIPFGVGCQYGCDAQGQPIDDEKPWTEYIRFLEDNFREWKRVLRPGGRAIIDCDSIRTRDAEDKNRHYKRPIIWIICELMEKAGFWYREDICWVKNKAPEGWAVGTHCSPLNPILRREHQYHLVFSADQWDLPCETNLPTDMTTEEFNVYDNSVWKITPETDPYVPHAAAMPLEIPMRLIKLYSWPGDWILDPFAGTATTLVAAATLNRHWTGVEANPQYCEAGIRRITEALDQKQNSVNRAS